MIYLGSGKRFDAFVQIIEAVQQRIRLLESFNRMRHPDLLQCNLSSHHCQLSLEVPYLENKLRSEDTKLEWFAKTLIVCAFEKAVQESTSTETQKARNGLRYMNCLQDLGSLIEEAIKRNKHLKLAEAFWKIMRASDRLQEHKLFLLSFRHLIGKLTDRRMLLAVSAEPSIKVIPDELIKAVVSLEELAINRMRFFKKWALSLTLYFAKTQRRVEICSRGMHSLWRDEFCKENAQNACFHQVKSQQNLFICFAVIKKLEAFANAFQKRISFCKIDQESARRRFRFELTCKGLKNLTVLCNCLSIEQKRRVWSWLVQYNYRSRTQLPRVRSDSTNADTRATNKIYLMWRIRACTIVLQELFRRRMLQYFRVIRKCSAVTTIRKPEKIIYARTSDLPRRSVLDNLPMLLAPENLSAFDKSYTPGRGSILNGSAISPLIKRSIGHLNSLCAK